jgi:hypothetical protein
MAKQVSSEVFLWGNEAFLQKVIPYVKYLWYLCCHSGHSEESNSFAYFTPFEIYTKQI